MIALAHKGLESLRQPSERRFEELWAVAIERPKIRRQGAECLEVGGEASIRGRLAMCGSKTAMNMQGFPRDYLLKLKPELERTEPGTIAPSMTGRPPVGSNGGFLTVSPRSTDDPGVVEIVIRVPRRTLTMATCTYSTVVEHSADRVWDAVRDFDRYEWAGNVREAYIENGMAANTIGAIRCVSMGFTRTRQRLLAYSEADCSYTYGYCDPSPIQQFRATLHVVSAAIIPIIHGDRASVGWQATFECPAGEEARWNALLSDSFARSLESLKKHLAGDACPSIADGPGQPIEEDHRSWGSRAPSPTAPSAPERDAEWLWKTIQDAAKAN